MRGGFLLWTKRFSPLLAKERCKVKAPALPSPLHPEPAVSIQLMSHCRRHFRMITLYSAAIADRILGELGAGRSLHDICRDDGMPHQDTVLNWVRHDRNGFAARYRQARQCGHGCPGRVDYSPEIADRFLLEVMSGRTMIDVCSDPDMPHHATVNRWVATDHDGFAARYRSARQVGRLSRAHVTYTPDIANQVLDELMSGRTLEEVCADPELP